MSKINEKELFGMGWVRLGDNEDDPFYRFHSSTIVLTQGRLSGNLNELGCFEIYGVPKVFTSIENLKKWVATVGFVCDYDLTRRLRVELKEYN